MTTPRTPRSATLAGKHILLPVQRRAEEFAESLERHGAQVTIAAPLHIISTADDPRLLDITRDIVTTKVDYTVVHTAVGFNGWLAAIEDKTGLHQSLISTLKLSSVLARGAKPKGAIIKAGLTPSFTSESETSEDVLTYLLDHDLQGKTVVVQHHGAGDDHFEQVLRDAGAHIIPVTTYRWTAPLDPAAVQDSISKAANGEFHAILFTSAPAASAWIKQAKDLGVFEGIVNLVANKQILIGAVGPVTAEPLIDNGLSNTLQPDRFRLGALVKAVVEYYS